ncbi:acyl-(acyl-carrier-protein)-UDP-N-acetylglucosamine O-acyltransferase [gamma proteobacterium HTCC5015]|nr:acyl-(acyl-carrier-protein)-UDP-N-acetylglucosamine O-acyltransferase [gamma proteobacterium HTCC5015]
MIHETAIVASSARIAEGVSIGAYSVIGDDVVIGAGTVIDNHVVIKGPTVIGRDNHFYSFSSIGEEPQDLKYQGEPTRLEIGDRNKVREFCTFNRGTEEGGGLTKIGSDNLFMAYCHVAHDCWVKDQVVVANNTALAGHVTVENGAKLGGFTLVHQFCHLGSQCFTSMGSAINKDVTPYTLVAGNYANAIGINKIGLKRAGMSEDTVKALHKAFRVLVYSKKSRDEALETLAPLIEQHAEVREFVEFVQNSERGVVRSR